MGLLEKMFGTHSTRELKYINPIVDKILALDNEYSQLSDDMLCAKTNEFKDRLAAGETLDDILPEAFACVREASSRVIGLKHYPVQLIGGIVLHQGRISEMKTGEGKTLVATLPAYLNALSGDGVHIITVNDYLAKRDSEWMGKVFRFLGLSVGLNIHGLTHEQKQQAYNSDITYGTNNEFGFDYLRDNMVIYKEQMVQRGHNFCIVDEVDSILIDEARTPLIISGAADKANPLYEKVDHFAKRLTCYRVAEMDAKESTTDIEQDYIVDEKAKTCVLTPNGIEKAERAFGVDSLTAVENSELLHHINQAIRAYGIMKRDIDYVVKDDEVIIVDEFTGRLMIGRRYSNGLHQAIEAKEGVKIERESKTLATITFQNYFRLYKKLSGMTGTALTEEQEFREIYSLDVIEIPTNRPVVRMDYNDSVYKTEKGKFNAVCEQVEQCHEKGQPVLVGTISIEKSELLSKMLKQRKIPHNVLNAKNHDKEAEIVAQAGKKGAVTIATNMAGRGTDIMLGGNADYMAKAKMRSMGYEDEIIEACTGHMETDDDMIINARTLYKKLYDEFKEEIALDAAQVKESGGLFIIGTERHDSRRIDNQLRGRAGRQGDPGETRFYISMEDDLMRLFAGDRMNAIMNTLGYDESMPIEHKMLTSTLENAQKRVESRNFQTRKHVLEYDNVMNTQREVIYGERKKVLDGENIKSSVWKMVEDVIKSTVRLATGSSEVTDNWSFSAIHAEFDGVLLAPDELNYSVDELDRLTEKDLVDLLINRATALYEQKEEQIGQPLMRELERVIMLKTVDKLWMDHIDAMDDLKQGISLRSYAQKDPVVEFKREGFDMFDALIDEIKHETVRLLFTAHIKSEDEVKREQVAKETSTGSADKGVKKMPVKKDNKPGRNELCPCGSGLKYKKCCGRDD